MAQQTGNKAARERQTQEEEDVLHRDEGAPSCLSELLRRASLSLLFGTRKINFQNKSCHIFALSGSLTSAQELFPEVKVQIQKPPR